MAEFCRKGVEWGGSLIRDSSEPVRDMVLGLFSVDTCTRVNLA